MTCLLKNMSKIFPPQEVIRDGREDQKVACRLGIIHLSRQICFNRKTDRHVIPGNAVLPDHHGMIISRSLQEWACLLSLDLPFAVVDRLLQWQTQCEDMICSSEIRRLVSQHGSLIREAETQEVDSLMNKQDIANLKPHLVPHSSKRGKPAWPEELNEAVEKALECQDVNPPEGVKFCDWERVIAARREEHLEIKELRSLGPRIQSDQVIACTDDVEVRRPEKKRRLSIRTARVDTPQGYRYLSGTAEGVLNQLYLLLILCGGIRSWVILLGDGAKWIRDFFTDRLKDFAEKELILDWYHLCKKCYEFTSMICWGRKSKALLMSKLIPCLWRGEVKQAISHLESYRSECRNKAKLDELINYLSAREPFICNYRERRINRVYIGSGLVEKANDLIVARRQKHKGMHWSEQTAYGLASLKTLVLNRAWDKYWQEGKVMPLAANA
jgi:hypothetical protein